jgi:hypothetical protein
VERGASSLPKFLISTESDLPQSSESSVQGARLLSSRSQIRPNRRLQNILFSKFSKAHPIAKNIPAVDIRCRKK